MTPCRMCRERVKDWEGDDPSCAFPDDGPFRPDNWNCATANALREIVGTWHDKERKPGVSFDAYGDQPFAMISLENIDLDSEEEADGIVMALWLTWYKERGATDAMWIMTELGAPRRPTEADALRIIASRPPPKHRDARRNRNRPR